MLDNKFRIRLEAEDGNMALVEKHCTYLNIEGGELEARCAKGHQSDGSIHKTLTEEEQKRLLSFLEKNKERLKEGIGDFESVYSASIDISPGRVCYDVLGIQARDQTFFFRDEKTEGRWRRILSEMTGAYV